MMNSLGLFSFGVMHTLKTMLIGRKLRRVTTAGRSPPMNTLDADPAVRQRLVEFLGGDTLEHASAVYLTHSDGCQFDRHELRTPAELDWFLERRMDIARSLADTRSCLLHLDIEYVNFDSPAEAFVDPWRCFELQEPVVKVIESLLLEWGIRPLHLITGQGHHFIWRIGRHSDLAQRIITLCPAPELTAPCMERLPPFLSGCIHATDQEMFAATSLLIEFVAHRIKERVAPLAVLPVEITAVHVGPCATAQREMISIDISEYGDPLHTRMTRMPFTNYRKPWVTGLAQGLGVADQIPAIRSIPLHEMDFRQALKVRQVDEDVLDLARRACVRIPLQEEGTARLLEQYLASRLRRFHEYFYAARHDPRERWPQTYDHTPLEALPNCVRNLLEWPNDRLLKPAGVQLVTRCLLAQGWHPRHIAGLIFSKFDNPAHGWGVRWGDYEAATRADFYTRLFAGQHLTGLDQLVDFNCTSTREKGFCVPPSEGSCSLESLRQTLLSQFPT
jgi:hypothetical protein